MNRDTRRIAEEKFAQAQKKRETRLSDEANALRERIERTAELKRRRLLKEAEEKRTAPKLARRFVKS